MARQPIVGGDIGGWGAILNGYLSQSLDATGGVTASGSTTSRVLPTRFAEVANVKDFGATGDGITNDATAIQTAIASLQNTNPIVGGVVFFPTGDYSLGTTGLQINRNGVRFVGSGRECTRLVYAGTSGAAISANPSGTNRSGCAIEGLRIRLTGAGAGEGATSVKAVDFSNLGYSWFKHNAFELTQNNQTAYYASGNSTGTNTPYYNVFCDNTISGSGGGATGQIGYYWDGAFPATGHNFTGAVYGPNANSVSGGRVNSVNEAVRVAAGYGNTFRELVVESLIAGGYVFRVGDPGTSAQASGTSSGAGNDSNRLFDSTRAWPVNAWVGGAIQITGGTGSGQWRTIRTSDATKVIIDHRWDTVPDATSTYTLYGATANGNTGRDFYIESSGATGLRIEPGSIRVTWDVQYPSGVTAFSLVGNLWRVGNKLVSSGIGSIIPLTFKQDNVADSQTNVAMAAAGGLSNGYPMPFGNANAWLVGIAVHSNEARTAGTLAVKPTEDGSVLGTLQAQLTGDSTTDNVTMLGEGGQSFSIDLRNVGCAITTSTGWTPTTADVTAILFVKTGI